MSNRIGVLLVLMLSAGTAMADFVPIKRPVDGDGDNGFVVNAHPLNFAGRNAGATVYSSLSQPAVGHAMSEFSLIDDFATTIAAPRFSLKSISFAGGVGRAGDRLNFNFYDSSSNFVTGFAASFPRAGEFIWNVDFEEGLANVPSRGFLQINTGAGSTGQWLMTGPVAAIGFNNASLGSLASGVGSFEFVQAVPLPPAVLTGGVALAGLMGVFALRRRKA